MDQPNGADVSVEVGGQKFNVRNVKSLNTLATVATLIVCVLLAYMAWEHKAEAKEASKEITTTLASAIKEMTAAQKEAVQAQRVMNCLIATDQKDRQQHLATCERIAR